MPALLRYQISGPWHAGSGAQSQCIALGGGGTGTQFWCAGFGGDGARPPGPNPSVQRAGRAERGQKPWDGILAGRGQERAVLGP